MQTSDWLSQQICDRLTTNVESALHNHCRETKNNASRTFFLMHGANEIISRYLLVEYLKINLRKP